VEFVDRREWRVSLSSNDLLYRLVQSLAEGLFSFVNWSLSIEIDENDVSTNFATCINSRMLNIHIYTCTYIYLSIDVEEVCCRFTAVQ